MVLIRGLDCQKHPDKLVALTGDAVGKLAVELKRHDLCLINTTLRIDIHLEQ